MATHNRVATVWVAFAGLLVLTVVSARLHLWLVFAPALCLSAIAVTFGVIVTRQTRLDRDIGAGTRGRRDL
ncbi:hypothetical protein [Sphaerisporangium fuscum]|uniref:hypothetical protein n=1 Tax=Sphaerisporangium fuscum TaxID=2835868 RepID=UPI001BDD5206|nr:hypothetical protein [Sphaerisporangium fuscum]